MSIHRSLYQTVVLISVIGLTTSCLVGEPGDEFIGLDAGMSEEEADEAGDLSDWTWDDGTDYGVQAGVSASKAVLIHPGRAQNAELIKSLPVGRSSSNAQRRVVMRLSPSEIPKLKKGDRLMVQSEVQVTTRCDIGQNAAGCGYNPKVSGQLILTGSRDDKTGGGTRSKALSSVKTLTCSKNEHHCLMVFRAGETSADLEKAFNLPCVANNSCHINLVMWAWNSSARAGGADKVLVGENEGNYLQNGKIGSDKARLMVIRERGIAGSDRLRRETASGGNVSVNTNTNPVVIYSHRLGNIKEGEQFIVDAKMLVHVGGRARFSTKMFLTKNPKATDAGGITKVYPGQLGEHNGINCTPSNSPCTVRKVAVFRATGNIDGPVFVNIIAKSAIPGGGSTSVKVDRNKGFVRTTKYRSAVKR